MPQGEEQDLTLRPQITVQLWHIMPRLSLVLLLAAAFFSLTLPVLAADPGDLDPSFGNGGVVTTTLPIGNFLCNAIAIQSDVKIVAAGHDPSPGGLFVVLRHNTDGSLDSSFGNNGVVTSSFNSSFNGPGPVGLALQSDGKMVVVGTKHISSTLDTIALARYTITGSIDSTFGQGGVVTTTIDNSPGLFIAVAIQSDGKIVIGGTSYQASQENFTLVRYTITGTLDNTFGSNGVVTTSIIGRYTLGYGVVIQSNGKIVIAGSSGVTNVVNSGTFALARYTIAGSLDSTFGNGGVVTTPIGSHASGDAVVVQPDDKILIVGSSGDLNISTSTFALARYNPDGSLDNGFGNSGVVTTSVNGYGDGNGVALQPDGKIVVVGSDSSPPAFALVRYNSDGSPDNSFGNGGVVTTSIANGDVLWTPAIQPDNKIVAVGGGFSDGYALARYLGGELAPNPKIYLPVVLKQ